MSVPGEYITPAAQGYEQPGNEKCRVASKHRQAMDRHSTLIQGAKLKQYFIGEQTWFGNKDNELCEWIHIEEHVVSAS